MPKKKRRKPIVPVTTFGDIAFLLIIFFMVASVFMQESHIDLSEASSPDLDRVDATSVSVVLDKHGKLWLQGEPCPEHALEPAVAGLLQDSKEKAVTVKIDRDQPEQNYGPVLSALAEAGADIILIGEKEDTEK